jgi:hypothetical protein
VAIGANVPSPALALSNLVGAPGLPAAAQDLLRPEAGGEWRVAQTEATGEPAAAEEPAAVDEEPPMTEEEAAKAALEAEEEPIDPRAVNALIDMGESLIALEEFAILMHATAEQVMDSGQKIEFGGTALYRVRRPDRLRLDVDTDTGGNQLYYDGATVTVFTPAKDFYGTIDGKATIRETIEYLEDEYGIETPLADLFDWGTERAPFEELEFAFPVGTARINQVMCGHYAFRTAETDWEVWIELGDRKLPLKFAITDRTQDSLPRFEAHLTWSTVEAFDEDTFTFTPPSDAKKIPLVSLTDWAKIAKKE